MPPQTTPEKQYRYQILFPKDINTKALARRIVLDTFYPYEPTDRVIIIHTWSALSRKTWRLEAQNKYFHK
jgi:hypothetical protein